MKIPDKNIKRGYYYKCNICQKISQEKYRAKLLEQRKATSKTWATRNKELSQLKSKLHGLKGRERQKKAQQIWYEKNKNDPDYLANKREYDISRKENLTDSYIKNLLAAGSNTLRCADLDSPAIIELKRAMVKIKRTIKKCE
ncbi:MAG: hypothetical protein KIH63_004675 [Candidatus Saccharibacteria bacterium]|nr:hypothetical protein [Candidatus Saccharibacteria bacterium]